MWSDCAMQQHVAIISALLITDLGIGSIVKARYNGRTDISDRTRERQREGERQRQRASEGGRESVADVAYCIVAERHRIALGQRTTSRDEIGRAHV